MKKALGREEIVMRKFLILLILIFATSATAQEETQGQSLLDLGGTFGLPSFLNGSLGLPLGKMNLRLSGMHFGTDL